MAEESGEVARLRAYVDRRTAEPDVLDRFRETLPRLSFTAPPLAVNGFPAAVVAAACLQAMEAAEPGSDAYEQARWLGARIVNAAQIMDAVR